MVYAIALIIFSQSRHNMAQVTTENGIDFTVSFVFHLLDQRMSSLASIFTCTDSCLIYNRHWHRVYYHFSRRCQ